MISSIIRKPNLDYRYRDESERQRIEKREIGRERERKKERKRGQRIRRNWTIEILRERETGG